ncbi:MAG: AarF/UbiB family protein, partial [bacterium]|nr:AarF/UbiB family protein [bacterium]
IYMLDDIGKNIFLRKLLTGKNGVLDDKSKRSDFLNVLINKWVEQDTSVKPNQNEWRERQTKVKKVGVAKVLDDIAEALGNVSDWEHLYFALQGVLQDNIGRAPQKSTPWDDLYEVSNDFDELDISYQKTKWPPIPEEARLKPWLYRSQYAKLAEEALLDSFPPLSEKSKDKSKQKMSPMRFIKEAAATGGALGVRFLQQVPLIANISPEDTEQFYEVYDRVKGQSKLAAIRLLEREWPGVWEEMKNIGTRLGGGSIVTVYKAERKDGTMEALKVRNPNIIFHVNELYNFASQVIKGLVKENGDVYKPAQLLLDEIKEWILNDISFEGFLEKDQQFYDIYNGYGGNTTNQYKVRVPKSFAPASAFFCREELVEGKNFTRWDELVADGHDMKKAVSLLVQLYVKQIMDGRLVQSDVHPGNFSLTEKGELVVYDRNFYLELSDVEKDLISTLMNPFSDINEKKAKLLKYFSAGQSPVIIKKIGPIIENFANAMSIQNSLEAQKALVDLKKTGIKVPLNFTLLLKNLHVLQMMSKKAGFTGGLFDAFMAK